MIEAFIRIVDTYSRAIVRTSSIQALLEAGIPVAVVGQNWQNFSCRNKELLTILSDKDGVSIDEVLRFMSNFQIVLNISDNYSQGGHERVPTAMLSGCVCISTPSSYFQTKYEDKKEILYYDPQNIASLPSAVHWLWEHPEKAEEIARHGYEKAKKEDTWQIRAQEILEIIQQRK